MLEQSAQGSRRMPSRYYCCGVSNQPVHKKKRSQFK